jgi:hypothetical protein
VRRGLIALAALAVLAGTSALVLVSAAAFTATSTVNVAAKAGDITGLLHLYTQASPSGTDPDGLNGYALRRVQTPPAPLAASGQDAGIIVNLGGFPDANGTFTFNRVFTVRTLTFPAGVSQITVTVSTLPDPASGDQPLQNVRLSNLNLSGSATTVTMTAGQKRQLNLQVRSRKRFALGTTYYPRVVLTATYTGGPAAYYRCEILVAVTDAGF